MKQLWKKWLLLLIKNDYYYSFKAKAATKQDIISGTAPTLQEAEELIELFAEGDIIVAKEIIKIKKVTQDGTNQS